MELEDKLDEAKRRITECLNLDSLQLRGLAQFLQGAIHFQREEYQTAIRCYRRLAEQESTVQAWANLSVAYINNRESHKAIESCNEALECLTSPTDQAIITCILADAQFEQNQFDAAMKLWKEALPNLDEARTGGALTNIGLCHAEKGDPAAALEYYAQSLEHQFADRGIAYYDQGKAYAEMGSHDKAIECFHEALKQPDFKLKATTWSNIGLNLQDKGSVTEAIRCWEKAKSLYEKDGEKDSAAYCSAKIKAASVEPARRSQRDKALLDTKGPRASEAGGPNSIEERIKAKMAGSEQDAYERYADRESVSPDNTFAVLKGWGSTAPLVEGGYAACRGGGYFLRWQGKGLVLDPGFDFLRNFHDGKFHMRDVDAVVVTHNHSDHNHDLHALDDIYYELWSRAKNGDSPKYALVWDEDTAGAHSFAPANAHHRKPRLKFDLDKRKAGQESSIDLRATSSLPFNVRYFEAKHGKEVPNAVGVRVECFDGDTQDKPKFTIGFSSDTTYYKGLKKPESLGGCDILVAHISQPDLQEFSDPKHTKKNHLGYRGVAKLVKGCKPRLTIVCEFWAGMADLRIDLVQGLRKLCGTEAILPGGVGLLIDPTNMSIKCTTCGNWRAHNDIVVAGPDLPFGPLKYLCPHCRL